MASKNIERIEELRIKRDFEYKQKKRLNYEKRKLRNSANRKEIDFDFEKNLGPDAFKEQMRRIAKMQRSQIDRQKAIALNLKKHAEKKSQYYKENREERLKYDAQYRERNKENLAEYRKNYYKKRKEQKYDPKD